MKTHGINSPQHLITTTTTPNTHEFIKESTTTTSYITNY